MFEWLKDFVPLGIWAADDTALICLKNKLLIKSNLMLKIPIRKSKSHIEQNTCQIQKKNKKKFWLHSPKTSSIMLHLRCRTPPFLFREMKNKTTTKKIEAKNSTKRFSSVYFDSSLNKTILTESYVYFSNICMYIHIRDIDRYTLKAQWV